MMPDEMPLVSVIIPCYNQQEFIEEAVDSVLAQTYPNVEIITVNDGSTDNSHEIIQKILFKNPEIKYKNVSIGGVSKARNIGIELALGKFILPLDADDLSSPEH